MSRAWVVVVLALVSCKGKSEDRGTGSAGSAAAPPHAVPLAVPTTTTTTVKDFLAQATGGGSAWSLKHVRVRGTLDKIERDDSGCIKSVTLRDGDASVSCVLVDPEPAPLHQMITVDGQVSLDASPPSLIHCRMLAPPGELGDHEPACADPTEKPAGSAAQPAGSAAKPAGSAAK